MKSRARICVPVCVGLASELREAAVRAAEVADLVELRLDCLAANEIDQALQALPGLLADLDRPLIVTMRSSREGGRNSLSDKERRHFWTSLSDAAGDCFRDIELDLVSDLASTEAWNSARVICSQHNFSGVPSDLEHIYERMLATNSGILKIAVQTDDATDCLPVFSLLARAQRDGREMIAIAMGRPGIMTRILGPSRGSYLTYGSMDEESRTAPGQITAKQLRDVYRIDDIDRQTEIVGLLGMPLHQSLSPHVHNAAFAAAGVNAVYLPLETHDVRQFMSRMASPKTRELDWNLGGLGVTAPHKSAVIQHLDWIDPTAKEIGAVNTIVVRDDELRGYNTDAEGFLVPLRAKLGAVKGARCAIIGAGGAARAVLWALRIEEAETTLFVRNPGKAGQVAAEFAVECRLLDGASFAGFDVLVNATPLGTSGERETETSVETEQFGNVRLAYDLVYNPLETRFLREAQRAGCETIGGIEMLLAQAIAQFKLWTGKDPDLEVMRAAALRALGFEPTADRQSQGKVVEPVQ